MFENHEKENLRSSTRYTSSKPNPVPVPKKPTFTPNPIPRKETTKPWEAPKPSNDSRKTSERGPSYGAKIECWKCHGFGHIASACPHSKKLLIAKADGSYSEMEVMEEPQVEAIHEVEEENVGDIHCQ